MCSDGKKEHFWLSPDQEHGYCHKCGWNGSITYDEGTVSAAYGDDMSMAQRLVNLMGGTKEGNENMKKLFYTPLDVEKLSGKWDIFALDELRSHAALDVKKYCEEHHVRPIDLARASVKILLSRTLDLRKHLELWNALVQPRIMIFFPIHRESQIVAAWVRLLNFGITTGTGSEPKPLPKWIGLGFKENGSILYTGALPSDLADERTNTPLVLVESAMDAIRVGKLGWCSAGVGGTYIPKKMRRELALLPFKNFVVLLDSDATDLALDLHDKAEQLAKSRGGTAVLLECPSKAGREVTDPASLDDTELRGLLMPVLPLFRAPALTQVPENRPLALVGTEEAPNKPEEEKPVSVEGP